MENILVIEDDELILESTAEFLKEAGYQVVTATDGLTGFQRAVEHYPDLIISDIAMPVFDGLKLYEMLQQNADTAIIPFIFLTAMAEKDDIRTGMQLGADDYITKPFDLDELHAAVKTRLIKSSKLKKVISDRYLALFENPLTGVYILEKNKLTFYNQKFGKIFGIASDSQKDIDIYQYIPENEHVLINEKLDKCMKGLVLQFNHEISSLANQKITIYGKRVSMNGKHVIIGNVVENGAGERAAHDLQQTPDEIYDLLQRLSREITIDDDLRDRINNVLFKENQQKQEINNPDHLTNREIEVLQHICEGLNTGEISEKLFISERTVDTHRSNLLSKTGSKNTANLVLYAIREGFVKT